VGMQEKEGVTKKRGGFREKRWQPHKLAGRLVLWYRQIDFAELYTLHVSLYTRPQQLRPLKALKVIPIKWGIC